jgi:hypothetical protein
MKLRSNSLEGQSLKGAASLRQADLDGKMAQFLIPSLNPTERTLAQVEGWILGVM